MYKRILVPTDGSATATLAADAAIELARGCGSEIVALSIAFPEPYPAAAEGGIVTEQGPRVDLLLQQADELVARIAERAQAAGVNCATVTEYSLSPAEAIVDVARNHRCDLIFMGSHGRRGLTRLIAGSVTQNVLAYSAIPVMVLRPPPAEVPSPPRT
ncbi:universal stress protein [Massilia niastensis]|uniref:universal stress protein n=1 Tax=Massilia niastensis TaxID=544911 RepID=UPI000361BE3D|nr:universal stress protein [Massilia niastensis]